MIGRAVLVVAIVVVSAITYPGALLVSLATRVAPFSDTGKGPTGALPWLHVDHPAAGAPFIADDQGRMVLLHGSIPASLLEFGNASPNPIDPAGYAGGQCPAGVKGSNYPPLCQSDVDAMAAMGFNSMRLPLSWSLLEPQRGQFNAMYVDRIAQIVDWARADHIYVIVDMHQNAFSHFVGGGPGVNPGSNSGAPQWATFTDGFPSRVYGGNREVNPAVLEANSNFWYDRDGIQDEYIAAVARLARQFKDDSTVAGFGIYNEPWFGWNLPPGFDDLVLFPFYRRVIDAITGVRDGLPCWSGFFMPAPCGYRDLDVGDHKHLMFLDTGLLREITDFPTHLGLPVSSYPNVVLSLHAYTHIYTADYFLGLPRDSYPWAGFDQSWDLAEREAKAMDVALFLEEFGSEPGKDDSALLAKQLLEAEKHRTGFAFWVWAENDGTWGLFDGKKGCVGQQRERLLARVYPRLISAPDAMFHYDPADGRFSMQGAGGPAGATTVVYIPPEVRGQVTSDGAVRVVVSEEADGSRLVVASPSGGRFTIAVAPAPLHLTGCE